MTKDKLSPIYLIATKTKTPVTTEVAILALKYFVELKLIEPPTDDARFVIYYDYDMNTKIIEGQFMFDICNFLLDSFPELKNYITISGNRTKTSNLDIHINGCDTKLGYFRIVRIVQQGKNIIFD